MTQHRYPQPTHIVSNVARPKSPTGNYFGYSDLQTVRLPLMSLTASVATSSATTPTSDLQEPSLPIVAVGKIVVLALWFWCAIGVNFCLDSAEAIATHSAKNL